VRAYEGYQPEPNQSQQYGTDGHKLNHTNLTQANLTDEELSRRCGIPLRTYVRWETGEAMPRPAIPQVKALCRELQISIEDLPDELTHQPKAELS
jgi:transcriptional regulator with XRE-family HTH domain